MVVQTSNKYIEVDQLGHGQGHNVKQLVSNREQKQTFQVVCLGLWTFVVPNMSAEVSAENIAEAVYEGYEGYEAMIASMDGDMAVSVFNVFLSYSMFDEDGNECPHEIDYDKETCQRLMMVTKRMEETECDIKKINIEYYYRVMVYTSYLSKGLKARIGKEWFSDGKLLLRSLKEKEEYDTIEVIDHVKIKNMSQDVKDKLLYHYLQALSRADCTAIAYHFM